MLVPFDLENYSNAGSIVEKYMQEYGGLDMLANNASKQMQFEGPTETDLGKFAPPLKLEMWESMGPVNTVPSMLNPNILLISASRRLIFAMKKGSRIITTDSIVAFRSVVPR